RHGERRGADRGHAVAAARQRERRLLLVDRKSRCGLRRMLRGRSVRAVMAPALFSPLFCPNRHTGSACDRGPNIPATSRRWRISRSYNVFELQRPHQAHEMQTPKSIMIGTRSYRIRDAHPDDVATIASHRERMFVEHSLAHEGNLAGMTAAFMAWLRRK